MDASFSSRDWNGAITSTYARSRLSCPLTSAPRGVDSTDKEVRYWVSRKQAGWQYPGVFTHSTTVIGFWRTKGGIIPKTALPVKVQEPVGREGKAIHDVSVGG